jgi:hypothetical protein
VNVPIANDDVVLARTILLHLQSPAGAAVAAQGRVSITIMEDDSAPLSAAMQVSYVISPRQAALGVTVGELVSYTYQITNSGTVTLTSLVVDDGALTASVATLADLAPNTSVTGVFHKIVAMQEWPGPVQNTLVVTAVNSEDANETLTAVARTTLTLRHTQTALPLISSRN